MKRLNRGKAAQSKAPAIRDRIKELRRVRARDLIPNVKNWRTHPDRQRKALEGLLQEVGYAGALLARETDDGLVLIDGHLRAETTPDDLVPVLVLDVNEAEAAKLLATLDPLAALAGADDDKLAELLESVETEDPAVQELLDSVAAEHGIGESETKLKSIDVKPPPKMSWVLIGIPTVQFGEIAQVIEELATVEGIIVESTVNDGPG